MDHLWAQRQLYAADLKAQWEQLERTHADMLHDVEAYYAAIAICAIWDIVSEALEAWTMKLDGEGVPLPNWGAEFVEFGVKLLNGDISASVGTEPWKTLSERATDAFPDEPDWAGNMRARVTSCGAAHAGPESRRPALRRQLGASASSHAQGAGEDQSHPGSGPALLGEVAALLPDLPAMGGLQGRAALELPAAAGAAERSHAAGAAGSGPLASHRPPGETPRRAVTARRFARSPVMRARSRRVAGLAVLLGAGLGAFGSAALPSAAPAAKGPAASSATVVPADSALRALRQKLRDRAGTGAWPSLTVALVRGGRIEWLEGFGWADRERRIAATPDTVYSLGSLSKSITATALLRLVEQGRVRLDDPVGKHGVRLPDPLGLVAGLEVRHLLRMTGGIPHGKWQEPVEGGGEGRTARQLLERFGGPVAAPGERYLYSNLSFGALEIVVANAAGVSFEAYLRDQLFAPLGMRRSAARIDPKWRGELARKYDSEGRPLDADYRFLPVGGGGLYASAADLARYALLHLGALAGDALPSRAGIERLHAAEAPGEPSHRRYMAGWGVVDDGFSRSLLSDGQVEGANTALLLLPEQGLGVVCLVNRSGSDALEVAIEIADALRPGYRDAFLRYVEQYERAEAAPGAGGLAALEGSWRGDAWCGGAKHPIRMSVVADAPPRMTVAGIDAGEVLEASFSERADATLHGIRFAAPGFTGIVHGVDLDGGRRRAGARLEVQLVRRGGALVGAGMNFLGDDTLPVVIRLERER